jgi:hypothetical protein
MSEQNRLLTNEEKLQAISSAIGKKPTDVEQCITSAQDDKTANYYETVVIPQLLEEIEKYINSECDSGNCKYGNINCFPMNPYCTWWQQLKQKYGGK